VGDPVGAAPPDEGEVLPDRLAVTYRLVASDEARAAELADTIAREQTVEVPPGVGGEVLQARMLGRPGPVVRVDEERFDVVVAYPFEVTGPSLVQLLNVAYGNVSLMDGVRVVDVAPARRMLEAAPGPRFGVDGLRAIVGAAPERPLVSVALKPVGRSARDLADLASTLVRVGVDVIKDDHGLVDQPSAPFSERVSAVSAAMRRANATEGRRAVYFPNVTGPVDTLMDRIAYVAAEGCRGIMLCPSLMGLDTMRTIAAGSRPLALMAHPTHAQCSPGRAEGISPEVLFGTLYRMAGADAVVYVSAGGRFGWPLETCLSINHRLQAPLGGLHRAVPAPAGGMEAAEASRWFATYGPDVMLLIGGSLLSRDDVGAATAAVVDAARQVGGVSP
jgi:ribulose-bisphosphate carboxylase large chain